jgi:hypothetical protein
MKKREDTPKELKELIADTIVLAIVTVVVGIAIVIGIVKALEVVCELL